MGAKWNHIVSKYQMHWLRIALAIAGAGLFYLVLSLVQDPFEIRIVEELQYNPVTFVMDKFIDLNNDGIVERIHAVNKEDGRSEVVVYAYNDKNTRFGNVIEQFNFSGRLDERFFSFTDLNNNDYKEMVTFTVEKDSLFLWIADISQKKWMLRRQPFLTKPNDLERSYLWDVLEVNCHFFDVNGDNRHEILIYVHTGIARRPRGLYVFDLQSKSIIKRLEFEHAARDFYMLESAHRDQVRIVLLGKATGNFDTGNVMNDQHNVVRILDLELRDTIEPLILSPYPAHLKALPVKIKDEWHLILTDMYVGQKNVNGQLLLVSMTGKILQRHTFPKNLDFELHELPFQGEPRYLVSNSNGSIYLYDAALNRIVTNQFGTPPGAIIRDIVRIDIADYPVFLAIAGHQATLFDNQLNILAHRQTEFLTVMSLQTIRTPDMDDQIYAEGHHSAFLTIKTNIFRRYSFIISLVVGFLIYMLLALLNKLIHQRVIATLLRDIGQQARFFAFQADGMILYKSTNLTDFDFSNKQLPEPLTNLLTSRVNRDTDGAIHFKDFILPEHTRVRLKKIYGQAFYTVFVPSERSGEQTAKIAAWLRGAQKIAHDIKTPLSSLILKADSLQYKLAQSEVFKDKEEIVSGLDLLQKELERIRQKSRYFIRFSEIQNPALDAVSLPDLIEQVIHYFNYHTNTDIRFYVHSDVGDGIVPADAEQLKFVFQVLIENALEVTGPKDAIVINLDEEEQDNGQLYFQVEVTDTGSGIPIDIQHQIFAPGFTTKSTGNGMGLAISRHILEQHGGQIDFYSQIDVGTTFTVVLPAMNRGNEQ
jgi:signal transduction histidine kinase